MADVKKIRKAIVLIVFIELGLPTGAAMAAGPYVVDDAGIVDPVTLQSESWYSHTDRGDDSGTINLAYQLLKNAEFMLQETHDSQAGNQSDTVSSQVKYLWREGDEEGRVASSVVLGGDYTIGGSQISDLYAYIPATLKIKGLTPNKTP